MNEYLDFLLKEGFRALQHGDLLSAEEHFNKAEHHAPGMPDVICGFAQLKAQKGAHQEAIDLYRLAIQADPHYYQCILWLGLVYQALDRLGEAEQCYLSALEVKPGYVPALNNLGSVLRTSGRLIEALEIYNYLIGVDPKHADAHFNRSLVLLQLGRYSEGWREYEWRFLKNNPVPLRNTTIPRWEGQRLDNKRILIHAEQGYGDSIQFVRYASLLSDMGATVLFEVQDNIIAPLMEYADGISLVHTREEEFPPADYQIPLMSIPMVIHPGIDSTPPFQTYIFVPDYKIVTWRTRLVRGAEYLHIGMAWAGRSEYGNDRHRSIPFELLTVLFDNEKCAWYSLQIGERNARHPSLNDLTHFIHDFSDTAAFISVLDLVITVDTAVAHLAGAIGKPVWLLLPVAPDWRWLMERNDSPWYPSMRIFRQEKQGEWDMVLQDIISALKISGFAP